MNCLLIWHSSVSFLILYFHHSFMHPVFLFGMYNAWFAGSLRNVWDVCIYLQYQTISKLHFLVFLYVFFLFLSKARFCNIATFLLTANLLFPVHSALLLCIMKLLGLTLATSQSMQRCVSIPPGQLIYHSWMSHMLGPALCGNGVCVCVCVILV